MSEREDHQRTLEELHKIPAVQSYWKWLKAMAMPPAFGMDALGRVNLHGLTAPDTVEYLQLHGLIYGDGEPTLEERARHNKLRLLHDAGMRHAYEEYRAHKISGAAKQ